jgi:mono/diheme cytochrome c family protein
MKQSVVKIALLLLAILFSACDQNPQVSSSSTGLMAERHYEPAVLAAGKATYLKHCAQCHGQQAEGHAQWRQPGSDGKYPPPPLNGSGHAWHHSREVLRNVIKNGSPQGKGNMPAWKDTLTDQQIEQVIDYFQSLWSDPVYAAWVEMQQNQR